jgi:hypothetical protein
VLSIRRGEHRELAFTLVQPVAAPTVAAPSVAAAPAADPPDSLLAPELPALRPAIARPSSPPPVIPSRFASGPAERPWQRSVGWTAAGAGGLLLAGGVAAHVVRELRWREFATHCYYDDMDRLVDESQQPGGLGGCQDLASGARRANTLAVVGYAGGALLGVTSLILLWSAPESAPRPNTLFACAPALGGLALDCQWRW